MKQRRQEAFLAGDRRVQLPGFLTVGDRTFHASLRPADDAGIVGVIIDSRHNDPRILPHSSAEAGIYNGARVDFSFRGKVQKEAVNRAYLRMAYLALFHHLGYPAIMGGGLQNVRFLLQNESCATPRCFVPIKDTFFPDDGDGMILAVFEPGELRCFVVNLAGRFVILPWGEAQDLRIYAEWQRLSRDKEDKLKMVMVILEIDPSVITSKGFQVVAMRQGELPVATVTGL